MTAEPPDDDLRFLLRAGAALFDRESYFEAHEAWEELWKGEEGDRRLLTHGLIQVAAAFVKWTRGEPRGAARLIERGAEKLDGVREPGASQIARGVLASLEPWRAIFADWAAGRETASPPPPLPKLDL
jgi:hypothetical protein